MLEILSNSRSLLSERTTFSPSDNPLDNQDYYVDYATAVDRFLLAVEGVEDNTSSKE
jgi:hypothetical protein